MIDFDELVVMQEEFIEQLNIAIDGITREKQELPIDYNMLEKALEAMVKTKVQINNNHIKIIEPIKREEALSIILDFFKNIDEEFYQKAVEIILQQNKRISMNIYNAHESRQVNKIDTFEEYPINARVLLRNGKAKISIPTKTKLNSKEQKILDKDTCILEDLYTIVHEIAHLLDVNIENKENDKNVTRELLGEGTAIAFEGIFTQYLLNNCLFPSELIQEISNTRIRNSLYSAKLVYAKLLLEVEKNKNGKITRQFVENIMRKNNVSVQFVRKIAWQIIHQPSSMIFQKRYAFGSLIAPTIIKKYEEEGVIFLKQYLENNKKGNFEEALKTLGISTEKEGIYTLIDNMKEKNHSINKEER